jgi:hypothetical protein
MRSILRENWWIMDATPSLCSKYCQKSKCFTISGAKMRQKSKLQNTIRYLSIDLFGLAICSMNKAIIPSFLLP